MNRDETERKEELVTLEELAYLVGTSPRVIERLVWFEILEPTRPGPGPCFSPQAATLVHRVLRIRTELGVSWTSMGLVIELLDRIDRLEERMRRE